MTASSFSPAGASAPGLRRKAFTVVLAIELWERFGYYGMQAVLTLFMVEQLRMTDSAANLMMGAFGALTYITPLIGGFIGDRVLGARRTTVMGALLLTCGYAFLAAALQSHTLLLVAMALISTGNGLFKPNAGNLVRRIYKGDDAALDAAFTLYYMSVNVGSAVSMMLTPWLQIHYGAPVAFATCAVGLGIGLVYYTLRSSWLETSTPATEKQPVPLSRFGLVGAGLVLLTVFNAWILGSDTLARLCVIAAGGGLAAIWVALYVKAPQAERPGLRLTYLLGLQGTIYLVFYQQMMTSLTLFALRGVSGDYRIGGITLFHMSAGQFQVLNSVWIMILSPVLAFLYNRTGAQQKQTSHARKMLIGYVMVAIAFGVWWLAAAYSDGLVSPWVMVVGYACLSLGELLTIGLGLAVVACYSPARLSGFMMGALYLMWGIAMYVGSLIANQAALSPDVAAGGGGAVLYAGLFRTLCEVATGVVVVLACLEPLTRRWDREHASVIAK
ncbi:peptide MFS transporter [Gluconobacter roseus]|uniref:MFS transporter n=1 Tax=Gluconobacter roseus NBRC 3990 TaxID=1307950 RepID=A0A4Y3MAT5_9PROT|nr:oligopeptide:H+ symporter [Gluconobacter roseus]KXV44996.1 peptide transporter [Gluconobacter roseus]GBR46574.1 amino acid transporter [Gluconobacter roseus NBRC 3990]GEB05006.1 MFS transporter [Gluconobacter roseus NBRC 3990]GLP94673.1 MFS transporter [Gluconobacter roseus NBRC 3990]